MTEKSKIWMRYQTFSQLPKIFDICSIFLPSKSKIESIEHYWKEANQTSLWFSRTCWSIRFVAELRAIVFGKNIVTVLAPDFFCDAALGPLRAMGAKIVLYPMHSTISFDIEQFRKILNANEVDLVIGVHYFGKVNTSLVDMAILSKTRGIWFIEDFAHSASKRKNYKCCGDFIVYSPYKHLPSPDGAILVVDDGFLGANVDVLNPSVINNTYLNFLNSNKQISFNSLIWITKRLLQVLGYRARPKDINLSDLKNKYNSQYLTNARLSNVGKRLLINTAHRLRKYENIRLKNTHEWEKVFNNKFVRDDSDQPYLYPVKFTSSTDRQIFYNKLIKNGKLILKWPDLSDEINSNLDSDLFAKREFDRSVYMPIHQSLQKKYIASVAAMLYQTEVSDWTVSEANEGEWNLHIKQVFYPTNFLQSWCYGAAKSRTKGYEVLRLLIKDVDQRPIAIAQVLIKKVPFLDIKFARINRAPLILLASSENDVAATAIKVIIKIVNFLNERSIVGVQLAPEIRSDSFFEKVLRELGFIKIKSVPDGSGLIDLNLSEVEILANMNKRFRKILKKDITIRFTCDDIDNARDIDEILIGYKKEQIEKNFCGIKDDLIRAVVTHKDISFKAVYLRAYAINPSKNYEELIGGRVIIRHGNLATDFLTYSSTLGRELNASTHLYWQAISNSKQVGLRYFDIGGLTINTTKGIREFKNGLGSELYELIGEWQIFKYSILNIVSKMTNVFAR